MFCFVFFSFFPCRRFRSGTTWRQSADSLTLSRSPNFLCALNRVVKSKETFLYFFVISLVSFSFFNAPKLLQVIELTFSWFSFLPSSAFKNDSLRLRNGQISQIKSKRFTQEVAIIHTAPRRNNLINLSLVFYFQWKYLSLGWESIILK